MTEEITAAEPPTPGAAGPDAGTPGPRKLDGWEKTAVEFGPLAVLLLGYFRPGLFAARLNALFGTDLFAGDDGKLYVGLALFLPAFALAFAWSITRTRRVAPILLVTAALTGVLGTLTFVLQDKTFFYMKPTIVYGMTAAVLAGGLLSGRNFLRLLFDGAFEMPDSAWRTLTWRFVAFNAAAAVANEIIWRTLIGGADPQAGEELWLLIKVWGFMGAYLVFVAANTPLILRHAQDGGDGRAPGGG